ncbi:MAG TPA: hypothetical protein VLA56_13015 [Pseudomonadales bacterium]|nr:hypothetical protein [Pseudomonadales bacterium]
MNAILRTCCITLLGLSGLGLTAPTTALAAAMTADRQAAIDEMDGQCTRPDKPYVPPGARADEDEMADAADAVRAFVADTQAYLQCLEAKESALGDTITPEQKAVINAIYNSAVDAMQVVADAFNTELALFREREE